jgi:DnaJ-class molecular chaperone
MFACRICGGTGKVTVEGEARTCPSCNGRGVKSDPDRDWLD